MYVVNSPFFLTPIPFVNNLLESIDRNIDAKDLLKTILEGRTVFDLGCGIDKESEGLQTACHKLGVEKYVGVDLQVDEQEIIYSAEFEVKIVKNDILRFLQSLQTDETPKVFLFFGIEPANPDLKETQKYIEKMMKVIYQKSRINDIILIGNGTHGIYPENFGFIKEPVIKFANFKIEQYVKKD